ncbi:MAG: hypothetical protein E6767_02590 [Dysgonomonas sp.]|nr:hypothetical protein [Dysgonomonas sp.]
MKALISYLFSRKKELYAEIARRNKCGPVRVCALAHGRRAKTTQDYNIIQELIDKGIVSGYRTI